MTPSQFADLAAAVASHSEELCVSGGPDAATLHRVWTRTVRCLKQWREDLFGAATPALYAEIFAAELPIRVWCTAVTSSRQADTDRGGSAIASKINAELLELRCVVLQALAADHGLTSVEAATIDRFRRRCERWSDVLQAPIVGRTGVTDYTIRPERALDFAERFTSDPGGLVTWQLVTAGLRLAFAEADSFRGGDHNRDKSPTTELASALFASFPPTAFSSSGQFRGPLLGRVSRVPSECVPKGATSRKRTPINAAPSLEDSQTSAVQPPHLQSPISFAKFRKRSRQG